MAKDASQIRPQARFGGSKAQLRARYFAEQRRGNGADPAATVRRYEAAFALRDRPENQDPQQPAPRSSSARKKPTLCPSLPGSVSLFRRA